MSWPGAALGRLEHARALKRERAQRGGIRADARKAHVPKRELAQIAEREVERRAEQDENAHLPDDRYQHAAIGIVREHLAEQQHHGKEQHDQAAVDAGAAQFFFAAYSYLLTYILSEDAGRLDQQHHDQDQKNTTAFASDELMYAVTSASMMPTTMPPSMAPGIRPMPPMTAATNALRPSMDPIVVVTV